MREKQRVIEKERKFRERERKAKSKGTKESVREKENRKIIYKPRFNSRAIYKTKDKNMRKQDRWYGLGLTTAL